MIFHPSKKQFMDATGPFAELRNDLAHGGTILDRAAPVQAIDWFRRIRDFAERLWERVEQASEHWDLYAATVIRCPDRK